MKKYLYILLSALVPMSAVAYTLNRVSVHDPSIVWEPVSQTYYIFGSHRASAKTTDMMLQAQTLPTAQLWPKL